VSTDAVSTDAVSTDAVRAAIAAAGRADVAVR
jgi:hypothetical protein